MFRFKIYKKVLRMSGVLLPAACVLAIVVISGCAPSHWSADFPVLHAKAKIGIVDGSRYLLVGPDPNEAEPVRTELKAVCRIYSLSDFTDGSGEEWLTDRYKVEYRTWGGRDDAGYRIRDLRSGAVWP